MEKEKKYDNNMRGALFRADRKNDRAPIASGTLTVEGVELHLSVWPKCTSKGGCEYNPVSVEYKFGEPRKLAPFDAPAETPATPAQDAGDLPF